MESRIFLRLQSCQLMKKLLIFSLLQITILFNLHSQPDSLELKTVKIDTKGIPVIKFSEPGDSTEVKKEKNLIFSQFKEEADYNTKIFPDIESFDKYGNLKTLYISFYKVKVPENMDFIWLAARLSPVTRETIATINRITSADSEIIGKTLLVPSFSGLFIPEVPQSSWEQMLHKHYLTENKLSKAIIYEIDGKKFYFFERERFNSTIQLFFLDTNMIPPLKSSVLTSEFGYRISPISGKWKFHSGIDLACPEGSSVYACKSGEISQTGFNSTYGNFIIIKHFNGMSSVYAHLSKIQVEKKMNVNAGTIIGLSGNTGASTGPHLHFEIRKNGNPEDPGKIISF